METAIRVILLLVGMVILLGIFWDSLRGRKKTLHKRRDVVLSESLSSEEVFEDVVLVKKEEIAIDETEGSPSFIMSLYVMARQPGIFYGKRVLEALQEAHLQYGDMQIFHRYENIDGSGQEMFSLASAVEPGVFDLSKMDSYVTPGIILFFMANRANHSITAFELMLRTAKLLAMRLDGELKDEERKPLSLGTIEKYRARIRSLKNTSAARYRSSA